MYFHFIFQALSLWVASFFSLNLSFAVVERNEIQGSHSLSAEQTASIFHLVFSNPEVAREMEGGPFSVNELMKEVLLFSQKGEAFYVELLSRKTKLYHGLFQEQIAAVIPLIVKKHPLASSFLGEFLDSPISRLANVTEKVLIELCLDPLERKDLEPYQARNLRKGQLAAAKALYQWNSRRFTDLFREVFIRNFKTAENLSEQVSVINELTDFQESMQELGYDFLSNLLDVHPTIYKSILRSTHLSHSEKLQKLFYNAREDQISIYRILGASGFTELNKELSGFHRSICYKTIRDESETFDNRVEVFIDFLSRYHVYRQPHKLVPLRLTVNKLSKSPFKTFAQKVLIMLGSEHFQERIEAVKYLNTLGVQYDQIRGLVYHENQDQTVIPVSLFSDMDLLIDASFGFFKTPDVDNPSLRNKAGPKISYHWIHRESSPLRLLEASIEDQDLFKQFIEILYRYKIFLFSDLSILVEQRYKLFHSEEQKETRGVLFFMKQLFSPRLTPEIKSEVLGHYADLSDLLDVDPKIRDELIRSAHLSHSEKVLKLFSYARAENMTIYRTLHNGDFTELSKILKKFKRDICQEIVRDESETFENRAEAFIDYLSRVGTFRRPWKWVPLQQTVNELSDSPFKGFAERVLIMMNSRDFQERIEAVKYLNAVGIQYEELVGIVHRQNQDEAGNSTSADLLIDASFGFFKTPDVDNPALRKKVEPKVNYHWIHQKDALTRLEALVELDTFKKFIDALYLSRESIIPELLNFVEERYRVFHPDSKKKAEKFLDSLKRLFSFD